MKTTLFNQFISTSKVSGLLIVTVLAVNFSVRSQAIYPQVIVSAGDYHANANFSISWTLGEIMTETFSNGTNILTQGFQQDSYIIIGTKSQQVLGFNINVYPNPAKECLKIDLQNPEKGNYYFDLIDGQGRIVLSRKITSNQASVTEIIQLDNLVPGNYFLKVTSANQKFNKTYKIIHQ